MWMKCISLLVVLGIGMAQVAQGQTIGAIERRGSTNPQPRIATSPLGENSVCYVDSAHVYKAVPDFLIGAEYIMPANVDKTVSGYELDVTLTRPAILYLFVDNRMGDSNKSDPPTLGGAVMQWVLDKGFKSIETQISIDEKADGSINNYFTIYSLQVPAGKITLLEQGRSGTNMYGVAAVGTGPAVQAVGPTPRDGAVDTPRDAVLSWMPAESAEMHDLYFGTVFADVNMASRASPKGVLVSQGLDANTYDPVGLFALDQTYYWRVDEVHTFPTLKVDRGSVWSFTAEPTAYAVRPVAATASSSQTTDTVPGKTIDGSGLNTSDQHSTTDTAMWLSSAEPQSVWIQYEFDKVYKLDQMWVWNSNQTIEPSVGLGAKDVVVEYSTDGATWTPLAGISQFAQATGTPDYAHNTTVDFGGVAARYVKITITSNWGDKVSQYGLSEVRFFQIPMYARQPQPASAATGVALNGMLNWRAGREAVQHDLYFSTDPNAVTQGTAPVHAMTESLYDLSSTGVEYDRTYYWKVNEVNAAANPTTWEGDLWSFSTIEYTVVDDFESYDDLCNRVYYGWVDGAGYGASAECGGTGAPGNGSGSAVGNPQMPYAERTIVHGGNQSIPMTFNNSVNPYYSEAQREWTIPQAWTTGGANTLKVSFRGDAPAFLETSPGNIVMNGTGTDIFNTADQGRFAHKSLTGDGSIVARVESLTNTDAWAKACVMIRETLESGSTFAMAVLGVQNGVRLQMRLTTGVAATSDSATATPEHMAVRTPAWIKIERKGNQFYGYYATDIAGTEWKSMAGNPQTITMASTVYIGLAVTSHTTATDVTDIVCGARFSSVSTQGNVTGSWQLADLGVTQPTGGNVPETFYVAVQDGSGKMKVVSHPDPVAMATGSWEEWNVPLSDITSAGVNLSNVKKLVIGVGDRNAPKAGGSGKVYIDDLRLTRVSTP